MTEAYYNIQSQISSLKAIKSSVMSDMKSYSSDETVHLVTKASLLLLGVTEDRTRVVYLELN